MQAAVSHSGTSHVTLNCYEMPEESEKVSAWVCTEGASRAGQSGHLALLRPHCPACGLTRG